MTLRSASSLLRLGSGFVGVALVAVVFEWPLPRLVPMVLALLLVEGYRQAAPRYGLNRGWVKLTTGIAVLALGLFGLQGDGALWAAAVFALLGAWLLGDALVDLRHGARDPRPLDTIDHVYDVGVVYRALREEPRGPAELAAALDCPRDRVERALETLERRNRVEEREGSYRATPDGGLAWIDRPADALHRVGRRLARPVRLLQ